MGIERKRIDVAVAVVTRPDGTVLWGSRPEGKPYAGYWEFPGGKVEAGESVWQALVRELREELGILALEGGPWFVIEHDYEHALVRLHLYRVWRFEGEPQSLEGQRFAWDSLQPQAIQPILPATEPLLPALNQPEVLALSRYAQGQGEFEQQLSCALNAQGRLGLLFREPDLAAEPLLAAFSHAQGWALRNRQTLMLNSATLERLLQAGWQPAIGAVPLHLHLTEKHLIQGLPESISSRVVDCGVGQARSASVHSREALARAFDAGLSFAVLGAVKETASHPGQQGLGWAGFERVVQGCRLPVYAIGGLQPGDLRQAQRSGAHGIAMIQGITGYTA